MREIKGNKMAMNYKFIMDEIKMKEGEISEKAVEIILTCRVEDLQNLTNTEIAKLIGVNRQLLNRSFKSDQGITLPDFILREKIQRAYFFLIENPGISIAGLSGKLGFPNVEDFYNEFEKYFAINPGKFRAIKSRTSR